MIKINCVECGGDIFVIPSQKRKYCSMSCFGKANTRNLWAKKEYRKQMSDAHMGNEVWNKGLKIQTNTGRTHFKKGVCGEKHPQWKGDDVGYSGVHTWVKKEYGQPEKCEQCGKDGLRGHQINWANKSGDYKRDIKDWIRLCRKCHHKYDNISKKRWNKRKSKLQV